MKITTNRKGHIVVELEFGNTLVVRHANQEFPADVFVWDKDHDRSNCPICKSNDEKPKQEPFKARCYDTIDMGSGRRTHWTVDFRDTAAAYGVAPIRRLQAVTLAAWLNECWKERG